jgi:carbonic anhydrase
MKPAGDSVKVSALLFLSLLIGSLVLPTQAFSGETDALLLSCMDYRLIDDTHRYMSSCGLCDKYDHVILAGSSLGAVTDKYPDWNRTFWEHLEVSIKLHHIKKVIILDHRDCGAYKVIFNEDFSKNPTREKTVHEENLRYLAVKIKEKYPSLETELFLMNLSGDVEKIFP